MNDPGEIRSYPFWALKTMHLMRPPNTVVRVRVRLFGGGHATGRIIDVGAGEVTVRASDGKLMEGVLPEWVEYAAIE